MQVITSTELRTKLKELVKTLKTGKSVELIHRSKVVGEIRPIVEERPLTEAGIKRIQEVAKELNLPQFSYKQLGRIHKKRLIQKYSKGLS